MALEIWLPPSARPKFTCNLCDAKFGEFERSAWIRHAAKCAKQNAEVLEAHSEIRKSSPFTGGVLDGERWDWVQRRTRDGKKVLPGGF